jgi:hypothetical protein
MNIQWEETGSRGVCFIAEGSSRIAAIHYIWSSPDLMVLDYLEFAYNDARQLLNHMVHHIVENARLTGARIIPLADPVMEIFDKTPAYSDVMYLKEKARGGVPFPGHPIRTREIFG